MGSNTSANSSRVKAAPRRVDWPTARDSIDLAAVATRLLGPAPGRRGERRGRHLRWHCPLGTHEDRNPSFSVRPGDRYWKCFGCGESGDAATLVMKVKGMTFPEAKVFLTGEVAPARPPTSRPRPAPEPPGGAPGCASCQNTPPERSSPDVRPPGEPEGMAEADALALVADAERRLWGPEGADALGYLHGRGLVDGTIRAARLGWAPRIQARTADGRPYHARGIVIPRFDGGLLTLVKVRQPEGASPKYAQVFRDRGRPPAIYPDRRAIRPGRPLVIVEGELDALLLGQELAGLAPVMTLGSASARPDPGVFGPMLTSSPWYVATDDDPAGDRAAGDWPTVARRVRPPGPYKDWTEAHQGGVNLARWWSDRLGGDEAPPLFTWPELAALRWGPSAADPSPGIDIGRPDRARILAALQAAVEDPHAVEERLAIRGEYGGRLLTQAQSNQ